MSTWMQGDAIIKEEGPVGWTFASLLIVCVILTLPTPWKYFLQYHSFGYLIVDTLRPKMILEISVHNVDCFWLSDTIFSSLIELDDY